MTGIGLLLRKEFLEQARTMRLVVVLAVFAILGLVSPVFARYVREIIEAVGGGELGVIVPDPTVADAVVQFTKNVGQFGALLAILLTMGTVATEKERGTAALILTKPFGRGAFLAAKVVAIGTLTAVGVALAAFLAWVYTTILFEPLAVPGFAAAAALVWLSLAVLAAITFAASVLTRSALAAGGIGIAVLLVTGVLSALPGIGPYLPTGLWGAADAIATGVVPDSLVGPVLVNIAVIVGALGLAWLSFRGQEL